MTSHKRRLSISSLMLISLLAGAPAEAAFISEANLGSPLFIPSDETSGGSFVASAEIINSATATPTAGVALSASGWTIASAQAGRLAFRLSSSTVVDADVLTANNLSASVSSVNNYILDEFEINPGNSGLSIGAAAEIRLQVTLEGDYQLQGQAASASMANFNVNAGVIGNFHNVVDFSIGSLFPTSTNQFSDFWDLIIPVTVGNTFRVEALMSGYLSGTYFDPGQSGTSHLFIDPIFRVSTAPGYDLDIVSSAGAAIWLFSSGLVGLLAFGRRVRPSTCRSHH